MTTLQELEAKYSQLMYKAIMEINGLKNRLIKDRQDILTEIADIKKEREAEVAAGKLTYDALKKDRQVYYEIRDALAKSAHLKDETAIAKEYHSRLNAREKQIAILARRMDVEGRELLREITEVEELEEKQLNISSEEIKLIEKEIKEIDRIGDIIKIVAKNYTNHIRIAQAANEIEAIEGEISYRINKTQDKIGIVHRKQKLIQHIRVLESRVRREGEIELRRIIAAEHEAKKAAADAARAGRRH
ncbi:MAG: hypothetical protein Q8O89_03785 [Nanoarchaeota archaeon]|nr:hypothetical protein [Nanoarchaeota archaeon]